MRRLHLLILTGFLLTWCAGATQMSQGDGRTEIAGTARILQSSMIWTPDVPPDRQAYVAFRKTFTLDDLPESARLALFADTRYLLWVNGTYLERGPARFDPKRPEYDVLEVGQYLHAGQNVLVVLVHNYPIDNFKQWNLQCSRMMDHNPGLTALLRLQFPDGEVRSIRTNEEWTCSAHTRYLPSAGTYSSVPDSIDARRDHGDWTRANYDDSEWLYAVRIDGDKWGPLHSRAIPMLREQVIFPDSLVQALRDGQVINKVQPFRSQLPYTLSQDEQIIIDVGRPVQGYPVVEFDAVEGSTLKMNFAARFFDTGHQPSTALAGHIHNTYIAQSGRQTYLTTDTFGFKYLILTVTGGSIRLRNLRVVDRRYPFDRKGTFTSSDPVLNRIWEQSVNTVELCSEDAYVDCADRERAEWLGDAVVIEYPVSRVTEVGPDSIPGERQASDSRLFRNMLRHVALSQLPDGRVQPMQPSEYPPNLRHGVIDDYSCLWVQGILEYFRRTGDRAFAEEVWPHVAKLMNYFLNHRTERGLVKAQEFIFFHNPLIYQECEGASINAYIHRALQDAAALGQVVNDYVTSSRFEKAAKQLYASYNTHLWDAGTGSYFGSLTDGTPTPPTGHAAVLALYYQMVPPERMASTLAFARSQFPAENPFPYTYKFFLDVLYRLDTPAIDTSALEVIRDNWQHMTKYETGTVSEDFDGGSYLHNAGAAPAYFLSAYVLGVQTIPQPDGLRLVVEPHLGDLQRAGGRVVTEYGIVPVSWVRTGGDLRFRVVIPQGADATVKIPKISDRPTLTLNGEMILAQGSGRGQAEIGDSYVILHLAPGEYAGSIR